MSKILIAADPEMFVMKDGVISSIAGVMGYGKQNKLDLGNGIRLQEDNVLIEFDVDPTDNYGDFDNIMQLALGECAKAAGQHGFELAPEIRSHIYTRAEIESFDPSALVFGCEPDYNALTGQTYPRARKVHPGLRSAGGHVHIGWDHTKPCYNDDQKLVAVMCDYFLGLPSLLLDDDMRRRALYGKAGCTRFKPYGIEYRTLSNFWVNEEANRKLVWEQTQKAFESHSVMERWQELQAIVDPFEVQRIINEGDTKAAERFIKLGDIA